MDKDQGNLKEQFQLLQEQQQQKLLNRRKKKGSATDKKGDEKSDIKSQTSGQFGVDDNMDLKLAEHTNKGYGYVSEELVDHLNDEIRQMKDENGRLYKLLSERDFEIRQLKKKAENKNSTSSNIVTDNHVTSETAALKIIELSKKVREVTAEKESEKTRCKQFQKKCHDLQMTLQSQGSSIERDSNMGSMLSLRSVQSAKPSEASEVDPSEMKSLQDRLKQVEAKVSEYRNQCQKLRQELKVAQKVLNQEIGENVNIPSLLNETSQWRGRAQQIIGLQQKVEELKLQCEGPPLDNNEKVSTARRRQGDKYREELRRADRERKEQQENTVTKLKNLEVEYEQVKNKLDASKTRSKVLSNEIKGLKAEVQTLLSKSHNDDEFIEALMKQQSKLKEMLDLNSTQQAEQSHQSRQKLQEMSIKSQQDNNVVEQLKSIAAQKEAQVKMLEMELQHLKAVNHGNQSSMQAFQNNDSQSSPTLDNDMSTLRSRPASQRSTSSRPISRSTVVLEASSFPRENSEIVMNQVSIKEKENLVSQIQELTVIMKTTEVEKDKMTDLVKVLQKRLTDEIEKHGDTQTDLQVQKRTLVEMEKQIGRQAMEAKKLGSAMKGNRTSRDLEMEDPDSLDDCNKQELLTRLEIQKDETEAMRAALQKTLKAKEEDLKVYSQTLEETKMVFIQALRQMKDQQRVS